MSRGSVDGPPQLLQADVVVLGAGPAGVPAAIEAADAGAQVALLDANPRPGGQYHRQPPPEIAVARPQSLHHGWRAAAAGFEVVGSHPRITHVPDVRAWLVGADDDGVTVQVTGARRGSVRGQTLVLATGATERVLPFPGWDLPGVLTVGAAQALIKGHGVRPGHRVLLTGTGPLLLAAASTLLAVNTELVAVLDANGPVAWPAALQAAALTPSKPVEALGYLADLGRARVPYRAGYAVVRVEGDGQVERAIVAQVDAGWRVVPGTEETVAVDAVCVGFGFTPNAGLAAALGCELTEDGAAATDVGQRTTVDRVLAAGEVTGVAGASVATVEGEIAGAVAADRAGFPADRIRVRRQVRRRDRERRAAQAVLSAAPVREGWTSWLKDGTVVCRCEEVSYGTVRHAIAELGARDVRSVKMTTRCGMGLCQAAMCGPNVVDLVQQATGRRPDDALGLVHRSIAEPVPLGEL